MREVLKWVDVKSYFIMRKETENTFMLHFMKTLIKDSLNRKIDVLVFDFRLNRRTINGHD